MPAEKRRTFTAEDERDPWRRMEMGTLELRRREFRESTMGERIDRALELNELANEIHEGMEPESR